MPWRYDIKPFAAIKQRDWHSSWTVVYIAYAEEPVHQLYAEILKRLDDSNDTVRKAACQTFSTFLRAAPKEHFKGTIIDYTLDCLFVHLDDSDPSIQVCCILLHHQIYMWL